MTQPRLYLVCGLPGAGKTTRSRQIVSRVRAVHLCADDWVVGLGKSLVDYEFRVKLQDCLLAHAALLLRSGVSVVIEFGSWHHHEREAIREMATREGAISELHFLDAPIDELSRRVRSRGGPEAEALANDVLLGQFHNFERPSPEEIAAFDRYVAPNAERRAQIGGNQARFVVKGAADAVSRALLQPGERHPAAQPGVKRGIPGEGINARSRKRSRE